MAGIQASTIGCCGIDCGLCPRYYTQGGSRCPGCGGADFELKHPSCGYLSCCVKRKGLAVCAQCGDFPCKRFDKETGERDSFVSHRKMMPNQQMIMEIGLDAFLARQRERTAFLKAALARFDNGKNKGFYCIAAALLCIESLKEALRRADEGEDLRIILARYAQEEGQELRLRK